MTTLTQRLPDHLSSTHAELYAILEGLHIIVTFGIDVFFFVDSQGALLELQSSSPCDSDIVSQCLYMIDSLKREGHEVHFIWVPSHIGIPFNEKADVLARSALHGPAEAPFIRLRNLDSKFGFLLDTKELLTTSNEADIKERCIDVANFYDTDLDGLELFSEIVDCRMLLKSRVDVTITTPQELLCFIVQYGDESVFPNLRVGLQILLTIAVSIASCERSFSKLKLILSYLRTSMGQKRLSALTLLSVEQEATNKINFDEVIDQFAAAKARKINL